MVLEDVKFVDPLHFYNLLKHLIEEKFHTYFSKGKQRE